MVQPSLGYSVLAHEAMVDALWDVNFKPVLLAGFPNATPEQLKEAHGYAYGGAIIQDLGYYPHSNTRFSDLTHYVRTGDFIAALIKDSQNLNELAFALGALSHYVSDIDGHRLATNPGEPGTFYAAPHDGRVHRSSDGGRSWEALAIEWPDRYEAREGNALLVTAAA